MCSTKQIYNSSEVFSGSAAIPEVNYAFLKRQMVVVGKWDNTVILKNEQMRGYT